jgi:ribosomal protein S18 acetylase RimI-like enzyme
MLLLIRCRRGLDVAEELGEPSAILDRDDRPRDRGAHAEWISAALDLPEDRRSAGTEFGAGASREIALQVWDDELVENTIEVRPFINADRDAVLNLVHRLTIGVAPWRDDLAVAAAVRGWIEKSIAPEGDGATFVAVAGHAVVGFVSVASSEHFTGECDAYIGELAVDAAFEGRGAGRRLIAAAEQWARQAGFRCITLDTGAANSRARRFYGRLGYGEEDVKLTKVLDAAPDLDTP